MAEKDRLTTLKEQALTELRALIVTGELRSGEVYREEDLVHRLERKLGTTLSRTPVSHGLTVLAREGFLEQIPLEGVRIRPRSTADASKILRAREVLEVFIAMELAEEVAAQGAGLGALREVADAQDAAAGSDDQRAFLERGGEFHRTIASLAGFSTILDLLESLWARSTASYSSQQRLAERKRSVSKADMENISREHRAILDALRDGPEATRDAVVTHFRMQRRRSGLPDSPAPELVPFISGKSSSGRGKRSTSGRSTRKAARADPDQVP